MQDSEFERKVQEQMQGFDLEPSPEVWVGVEKRIRKKKKRRLPVWWIFATLLLGTGITYMALENGAKKTSQPLSAIKDTVKKIAELPVQTGKINSVEKKDTENAVNKSQANKIIIPAKDEGTKSHVVSGNRKQKISLDDGIATKRSVIKKKNTTAQDHKQEYSKNAGSSKKELQRDTVIFAESADVKARQKPGITSISSHQPSTDSTVTAKDNGADPPIKQLVQIPTIADSSINPEPVTNLLKNKKKHKWEAGISFFAGKSNLDEGFKLRQNKNRENAFTVSNAVSPVVATVSLPKGSFSFQAGVFAKRKLSDRLDFYTHLSYSYLSASLLTGSKSDTLPLSNLAGGNVSQSLLAANGYYRLATNTDRRQYINRFHYVDLTAGVSSSIINARKFKLYWDNNIGYRRLLGSNMLHYSSTLPGYYRDNNLLLKNQFVFETGLMTPISKKLKLSTFISYTPSPAARQNDGSRLHFTQFGIRLKYLINKQ